MTDTYCKVVGGVIVARERKVDPISKIIDGEPVWRLLVRRGVAPAYDAATHYAPVATEAIEPTQVVQGWAAPVAKTQAEIDAENEALIERETQRLEDMNIIAVAMGWENRIRALEGRPAADYAELRQAAKDAVRAAKGL